MFGIVSFGLMLIGGINSKINQDYASTQVYRRAKKAGRKYYTDAHGNMREIRTNRIVRECDVIPRPTKTKTLVYKVINTKPSEYPDIPEVKYFNSFQDACDYRRENFDNKANFNYKFEYEKR